MFVPLPLFALAWQAVGGGWRPWTQGLVPAAFVHAMAALPWVVWLTGLGLARVEPESGGGRPHGDAGRAACYGG